MCGSQLLLIHISTAPCRSNSWEQKSGICKRCCLSTKLWPVNVNKPIYRTAKFEWRRLIGPIFVEFKFISKPCLRPSNYHITSTNCEWSSSRSKWLGYRTSRGGKKKKWVLRKFPRQYGTHSNTGYVLNYYQSHRLWIWRARLFKYKIAAQSANDSSRSMWTSCTWMLPTTLPVQAPCHLNTLWTTNWHLRAHPRPFLSPCSACRKK